MAMGWQASFFSDVLIYLLQHLYVTSMQSQLHSISSNPFSSFTLQRPPQSTRKSFYFLQIDLHSLTPVSVVLGENLH